MRRGEIPIGIADMGMTEVGGELRQALFEIDAAAVPIEQGGDGEAMTLMPHAAYASSLRNPVAGGGL